MSWVLVLDPPNGDAARKVGGLSVTLRLALDAQAGGASAIVAGPDLAPLLVDPRLRTPVTEAAPTGPFRVHVPASWVLHRQLFKLLAPTLAADRDLTRDAFAVDVPFAFEPIDVTDAASARRAERALFRALRKPQDGWTSRWLNRYVSLAISRFLVKTPLRPNQVSVGILAVGLFGAWLASRGGWASMALGAFLFQMQSILDGCDGEMSRITYRGSLTGEWLDTVGDDLTNYSFFGATGFGLYAATGQKLYLIAGIVTVACGVITSGIEYRYLIQIGSGDLLKYPLSAPGSESKGGLFDAIQPLFKRDTFVFLTLLAALAGLLGPMLVIFALGGVGILLSVLGAELRMARERRSARG
ncbi:MAG: CDP-alcohol phosphatidyltransferase family protein [Polyangiaceae bacterium]|nr:CDP-alcohol phosphatidyltransferase family protein [Polyangiaceae bacterium]